MQVGVRSELVQGHCKLLVQGQFHQADATRTLKIRKILHSLDPPPLQLSGVFGIVVNIPSLSHKISGLSPDWMID